MERAFLLVERKNEGTRKAILGLLERSFLCRERGRG